MLVARAVALEAKRIFRNVQDDLEVPNLQIGASEAGGKPSMPLMSDVCLFTTSVSARQRNAGLISIFNILPVLEAGIYACML